MKKYLLSLFILTICFVGFSQDIDTSTLDTTTEVASITPPASSTVEIDSLGSDINSVVEFIQTIPKKIQSISAAQIFYNGLYMALVIVIGYLSHLIPGLERITDTGIRVFVSAVVLGFIFVSSGLAAAFPLALEFIVVSKVYDHLLKGFKKTPKVEAKT